MIAQQQKIAYNWHPDKYIELIENAKSPWFQEYQKVESDYIVSKIYSPEEKTFIEMGAGYGRVIPELAKVAKTIIAIENDKNMLRELRRRVKKLNNVEIIDGNANFLEYLLRNRNVKSGRYPLN